MTHKFSFYGPIDPDLHYHAPRQALIDQAYLQKVWSVFVQFGE